MPRFWNKEDSETAPEGDPAAHLSRSALVPTNTLTVELLDWLIAALEAVLKTPQLKDMADRRVSQSLYDALRLADHLYPKTKEVQAALALHQAEHWPTGVTMEVSHAREEGEGRLQVGLEGEGLQVEEGRGEASPSGLRERLPGEEA